MTEHTRKERELINRAYRRLEDLAERLDMGTAAWKLKDALRRERRERSSITAAKALLVESALQGMQDPNMPAKVLYGYARGCLEALLIGAEGVSSKAFTSLPEDTWELFRSATKAHMESIHRALDAIKYPSAECAVNGVDQ